MKLLNTYLNLLNLLNLKSSKGIYFLFLKHLNFFLTVLNSA